MDDHEREHPHTIIYLLVVVIIVWAFALATLLPPLFGVSL
jgi:hypothetical protein